MRESRRATLHGGIPEELTGIATRVRGWWAYQKTFSRSQRTALDYLLAALLLCHARSRLGDGMDSTTGGGMKNAKNAEASSARQLSSAIERRAEALYLRGTAGCSQVGYGVHEGPAIK